MSLMVCRLTCAWQIKQTNKQTKIPALILSGDTERASGVKTLPNQTCGTAESRLN